MEGVGPAERIDLGLAPAGGDVVSDLFWEGREEFTIAREWEWNALPALRMGVGRAGLEQVDEVVALELPLPSPPHKGEGVAPCLWHGRANITDRHLPPCGGGWEGADMVATRREGTQYLHRRLRGVVADAVGEAAVADGVVGEDDGDAALGAGRRAQPRPVLGKRHGARDAVAVGRISGERALGAGVPYRFFLVADEQRTDA